jgi:hypothetical protein
LLGGCLSIALLIALISRLAIRRLVSPTEHEHVRAVATGLMTAFAATFAILAALTLANEAGYLNSAQTIVSTEAADASRLAWAATSRGVDRTSVQTALLHYLQSTRTYEWNGQAGASGEDPATSAAVANLERAVRNEAARSAPGTPASNELLTSLDALTGDRRTRLAAASRTLPALYVITVIVTGVALIVNASALTIRASVRAGLLVGIIAFVVGLATALMFALGTPWRGPLVVSGQPIDAVIHDL